MHKYMFYCKKCGHHLECTTKQDWLLEKQSHKRRGCILQFAPHRNGYILARPELAEAAKKGREKLIAYELSSKVEDNDDSISQRLEGVRESKNDSNQCTDSV